MVDRRTPLQKMNEWKRAHPNCTCLATRILNEDTHDGGCRYRGRTFHMVDTVDRQCMLPNTLCTVPALFVASARHGSSMASCLVHLGAAINQLYLHDPDDIIVTRSQIEVMDDDARA